MFDQAGGRKRALSAVVDFVDLMCLNVGQEHEEINAQELAPFWIFWHTLSTSR